MGDIQDSTAYVARREIRELIFNLETVLEEVGEEGGITVAELRESLMSTIADIKEQAPDSFINTVRVKASQVRETAVTIDAFVVEHPWTSLVIGAGIGWLARAVVPRSRAS
jgi:ElaB/YqjD/DUF883 family membrane-anchored ribosome-binding protein